MWQIYHLGESVFVTYSQCDARPMVTFPATGHRCRATGTTYTAWWQRQVCVKNLSKVVA